MVNAESLTPLVRAQAYGLGFDLVGITTLGLAETAGVFDEWVAHGQWLRFDWTDVKEMRFQSDELDEYEVRAGTC